VVAFFTMMLGDIPTAFGLSPYVSLGLIFVALTLFLKFFGKPLPSFPTVGE